MQSLSPDRLEAAYQTALAALMKERTPDGHWVGELSTSALSTATAVMALHLVQNSLPSPSGRGAGGEGRDLRTLIDNGLAWLAANQNEDGGWGDTTVSFSNISTTMLCRSAFCMTSPMASGSTLTPGPSPGGRGEKCIARAEAWLTSKYGPPAQWPEAIRQRYGVDRTFATPILTTCALAGLVSWDEVPPLPFELAVLPQSWFRFVKLHVVSYALPALIAIGQCIYHHKKPWNPFARIARRLALARTLEVLRHIQPSSGGYLEAIPLTSFVTMALASIGHANHPVAQKAVEFLVSTVRPDGSWAIDSNLATWVTTLSINALAAAGERFDKKDELRDWLLNQQYKERHPFTGADPGGWAWTDLPGGVPDADDTPGGLLALANLASEPEAQARVAAKSLACASGSDAKFIREGITWLISLQNRDGGWPTFCRGWGHLPFDRSGCDLTAHALRAISSWLKTAFHYEYRGRAVLSAISKEMGKTPPVARQCVNVLNDGMNYLARQQRPDGSWLPLWFGNQHTADDENPTYGTARVLAAYRDLGMMDTEPARKGIAWLLANQNADGGWGGGSGSPSSIEETALVIDVLIGELSEPERQRRATSNPPNGPSLALRLGLGNDNAVNKALAWLVERIELGGLSHPTPIGFYFAKLWYFEKLYPIIFSVAALGRARKSLQTRSVSN